MSIIALHATQVNAPASTILWRWEQYKYGRDLHRAGEQLSSCLNDEQRRGYLDALTAAADAETFAFLTRGQS